MQGLSLALGFKVKGISREITQLAVSHHSLLQGIHVSKANNVSKRL